MLKNDKLSGSMGGSSYRRDDRNCEGSELLFGIQYSNGGANTGANDEQIVSLKM